MNKFDFPQALIYLGFFGLIAFVVYYTNSMYPLLALLLMLYDILPSKK